MIAINCGSGQRPFGLPRISPTPHNRICVICNVSVELHCDPISNAVGGPMTPRTLCPHRYVPFNIDGISWVNIDINSKWNPDIVADWNSLTMFDDASVDYVVSHHSLEHVGCGEGDGFIREAYRVLKPGGSLLVFVPNMKALAKRWLEGGLTDQIYMTNVYGAYMGNEEDRHRWGYTGQSLVDTLHRTQVWHDVKAFNFRQIPGADIAQDFWILGMEAVK